MNTESAAVEAVAWLVTNGGECCEPWLVYERSEVEALPASCIADPLYPQSALDALRGEVESAALRGELSALENFLRMASEPVGQECCGQGRYECCGNPIPVFAQPNEVFQAMSDRHAEILASLAALTKESP